MIQRVERRREPRTRIDELYSVELIVPAMSAIYQFRIWNLSSNGMCIMVKDDSEILRHLKVGDVLEMKYNPSDRSTPPEHRTTKIRHLTKDQTGRFKGHTLVGLQILEQNSES
jgi:hypothetical protein